MADFQYYEEEPDYGARMQARNDCRNTTIYCVVSLALLIAAGAINSPIVAATIPGGQLTLTLLSVIIVVAVLGLCIWQYPRTPR